MVPAQPSAAWPPVDGRAISPGTKVGVRWATIVALLIGAAGCASSPALSTSSASVSPVEATPSLVEVKRQVDAHVDSGRYEAELAAAVDPARAFLESRVARGGKLAIVLDVDETALSNLPSLRANDWGFIVSGPCDLPRGPCGLLAWIGMARAEPRRPSGRSSWTRGTRSSSTWATR